MFAQSTLSPIMFCVMEAWSGMIAVAQAVVVPIFRHTMDIYIVIKTWT